MYIYTVQHCQMNIITILHCSMLPNSLIAVCKLFIIMLSHLQYFMQHAFLQLH